MSEILPSQHQPTKAEYMIKSTAHIDEIRSMNKSPHIVHVVLDRCLKNVYRQTHHIDEQGHNMVDIIRNMRGEIWWVAIKSEGQSERRKQGFVQRKQAGVIGHDL